MFFLLRKTVSQHPQQIIRNVYRSSMQINRRVQTKESCEKISPINDRQTFTRGACAALFSLLISFIIFTMFISVRATTRWNVITDRNTSKRFQIIINLRAGCCLCSDEINNQKLKVIEQ